MCYILSYHKDGSYNSKSSTRWEEMTRLYNELYGQKGISKLKITDMEYGIDYINGKWNRDSNFCGWAGGEQ